MISTKQGLQPCESLFLLLTNNHIMKKLSPFQLFIGLITIALTIYLWLAFYAPYVFIID